MYVLCKILLKRIIVSFHKWRSVSLLKNFEKMRSKVIHYFRLLLIDEEFH